MNLFYATPGSPLLPPEIIILYLLLWISITTAAYFLLHRHLKPQKLHHRLSLLLLTTISLKLILATSISLLLAYILVPSPQITHITPLLGSPLPIKSSFSIHFNRPISRHTLQKSISPDLPGIWVFQNPIYSTHLYRTLTFYPSFSLQPNTTYSVTLNRITNFSQTSPHYNHTFSFTTKPPPQITSVSPDHQTNHPITSPILITLDSSNHQISQFDYQITPPVDINIISDHTNSFYLLQPSSHFNQGTTYYLTVYQTNLTWDLATNQITRRSPTTLVYQTDFTTSQAPGIDSFTPSGNQVLPTSPITLTFTQPMDPNSAVSNFNLTPSTPGFFTWENNTTLIFTPNHLDFDTTYTITLLSGTKNKSQGFLENDIQESFTTIGPVRIAHSYPAHNWTAVDPTNPIQITLDQPVDPQSAQSHFSISPPITGSFSWKDQTLTFQPSAPLDYQTTYTLSLSPGIKSLHGLDSTTAYTSTFSTQNSTTKLAVPAFLQQYPLSCEVAALKMALAYKNISVSEDTLLTKVGIDSTPHQGNTWGDPYQAFVGNVRGRQMYDGYGVYWNPIARVASEYTPASSFESGTISQLTQTILSNHPVILWVFSRNGTPTHWYTPQGKEIFAAAGEHAVVATGFVGPASDPTHFIINDPLAGQVYWPQSLFNLKWQLFGHSGVVVY